MQGALSAWLGVFSTGTTEGSQQEAQGPELCPPAPATWRGLDGLQLGVREAEDRGEAVTLEMT